MEKEDAGSVESHKMRYAPMRGCEKKIYCVKNASSAYFEEAFFVLRGTAAFPEGKPAAQTLAEEAERIIREAAGSLSGSEAPVKALPPIRRLPSPLAFALGAASSSALIGTIALIAALA